MPGMRWDLFCRVVDNWGDAGVCWRLASELARRGEQVRLWVDDPSPLAWMAPQGRAGVEVLQWRAAASADLEPRDVVVEAFGCDPPARFVERMAAMPRPAVWINLEYLSAERYVDLSHALPSPQQAGPGRGLTKWFFFPSFTEASGGLIREEGLLDERAAFDRDAWLSAAGWPRAQGERVVTLFCYESAALPHVLDRLAAEPTLLLATAGTATQQIGPLLDATGRRGKLRAACLPLLPQHRFDQLLWAGDLNFVRGEDSLVRAIWAGAPFVWHAYPQRDGAHRAKLEALLEAMAAREPVRALWRYWNDLHGAAPGELPPAAQWAADVRRWRDSLARQTDLTTRLLGLVASKR
jgi:uncharacterized repeat protein (TIGR03837 family)